MVELGELADRVRSKNAGPLRLTFDVFFDERETYERVRDANAITAETVADQYGIDAEAVLAVYELDRIRAMKVTLRRPTPAGAVTDVDVYGTQQHVPLLGLTVND
ncbi:MAG: DUF4387 domain-containing protein [Salinirussus sp.]